MHASYEAKGAQVAIPFSGHSHTTLEGQRTQMTRQKFTLSLHMRRKRQERKKEEKKQTRIYTGMSKKIPNLGRGQKRDSVSSFLHPLRKGEEAARGRTGLCEKAAAQSTPVSAGSRTFSCVPSSKKRSQGGIWAGAKTCRLQALMSRFAQGIRAGSLPGKPRAAESHYQRWGICFPRWKGLVLLDRGHGTGRGLTPGVEP